MSVSAPVVSATLPDTGNAQWLMTKSPAALLMIPVLPRVLGLPDYEEKGKYRRNDTASHTGRPEFPTSNVLRT